MSEGPFDLTNDSTDELYKNTMRVNATQQPNTTEA